MKKISTLILGACILTVSFCLSMSSNAQSGPGGQTGNSNAGDYAVAFTTTPTLVSGTDLTVGAKYKFTNVASGTNAYVTIVSATGGAAVTILDDNSLTKPEAFSPAISVPANSTGLVEFKIEFINGGGNPKNISHLIATAMDIDGNANLHEIDVIDMGAGGVASYVNPTVEINMVQSGTAFTGTNTAGIEYTAVDTAAKQVMFTVNNSGVDHFTYKAGAHNLATSSAAGRQKGIYFKGFDYTLRPLAVKYASFTGTLVNKAVLLDWVTEEELNHSHFEVERSFDGTNFSQVAMVLDGFENGTQKAYAYKDNSSALQGKSIVYYRLKEVDLNGRFAYSNIVVIRLQNANEISMQVSPNPFTEKLNVNFNSATNGTAEIRINSIGGQTVLAKTTTVTAGNNVIQLNGLSSLPSGTYVATLVMNGKIIDSKKIIK